MKAFRILVKRQYSMLLWLGLHMIVAETQANALPDPAEISIGERLFLETRFAQAWYAAPAKAEPALEYTVTTTEPMRGPFAGQTMNCRACHMVDEHAKDKHGGMRTYADFAHRSLVPERMDGEHVTARNSMSLVNISLPRKNDTVFHFDGEFNSMEDLVVATLIQRNYGWLQGEQDLAKKHIANVIRSDDGKGELAREFGGSYRKILTATDATIKAEFRLPADYRIDVATATDEQIVKVVAKLISAYVGDLGFSRDEHDEYDGSPYDQFLKINKLPRKPAKGESVLAYSQRLAKAVGKTKSPKFVVAKQGKFVSHKQDFVFAEKELQGMKLFFAKGNTKVAGGNCIACHAAPDFSDFGFHNTGLSQVAYDDAHGEAAFNKLMIPDLKVRNKKHDAYLPATSQHPNASGIYRSIIDQDKPGQVDLGLWNVFANPDMPAPQAKLKKILCQQIKKQSVKTCSDAILLPFSVAAFKTPVLRDLGHSAPYMHSGQFTNLKEAIGFYVTSSHLAKKNLLRNAAPELQHINLTTKDVDSLVAFVKALNEDYE